jgi:hypothetical protein
MRILPGQRWRHSWRRGEKGARENVKGERTGGEPLWRVPLRPLDFLIWRTRPENVKAGGSRELPSAIFLPALHCSLPSR